MFPVIRVRREFLGYLHAMSLHHSQDKRGNGYVVKARNHGTSNLPTRGITMGGHLGNCLACQASQECLAHPRRHSCHYIQASQEFLEFQGCQAFLHALHSSKCAQVLHAMSRKITRSKDLPHLSHSL